MPAAAILTPEEVGRLPKLLDIPTAPPPTFGLKQGRRPSHGAQDFEGDGGGVCKYFLRGTCTYGNNCKFGHSGRSVVPNQNFVGTIHSAPNTSRPEGGRRRMLSGGGPMDNRRPPVLLPSPDRGPPRPTIVRKPNVEAAWEEGLKQAKMVW